LDGALEAKLLLNQKEIEIIKDWEEVRQLAEKIANLKKQAEVRRRYFT
jgi:hypothetical protein